jgi:hypothetical protein
MAQSPETKQIVSRSPGIIAAEVNGEVALMSASAGRY